MSKQCHTRGHARAIKDLQPHKGSSDGLEANRSSKVMKQRISRRRWPGEGGKGAGFILFLFTFRTIDPTALVLLLYNTLVDGVPFSATSPSE